MFISTLKRFARSVEARFTPRKRTIYFEEEKLRFVRSLWWNEADQWWFDAEIVPYFKALEGGRAYRHIVDAGGSTGLFAIAAAARFPGASIHVFEPSARNCILIARNAAHNAMDNRIRVHPFGLWNESARLAFRSHGAISSLQRVTMLDPSLPFEESVEVRTLDAWADRDKINDLDLIKMDIEGAEIEALEGAAETLRRFKPDILLQAYHVRDGVRTLERCVAFLDRFGYISREIVGVNGFVYARRAD